MKVSFNWIRELVALPAAVTADDVARGLTLAGLEVESIERRGREVSGVRVAEVRGIRPHPDAEKLRIVRVATSPRGEGDGEGDNDGNGEGIEVVCGAANVPGPGGRVAWAAPGATLPGGVTLGRKVVRGFDSPGMLCSERELGIGEGVDGILILSTDVSVGAELVSALGLADDVLEVNITPNRPDALSHAGIAREVAAAFSVGWRLPAVPTAEVAADGGRIAVHIADAQACPRYHATVIRGIRVGPSPLWMRLRLAACGVRAISNLVDVTNYVMLETGHPLHAFDLAQIEGDIVVRRALAGEVMRTLDGVDRKLETGDVVIADARKAVALAGVMGGATSEVTAGTTDVLLESATFDPRAVRRTAKRLGLHSEASHRFERGVDAAGVPGAGGRAAARMALLANGRIAGTPVDCYPGPVAPREVRLSMATLRQVAGFDVPATLAADKLRAVDILNAAQGGDLVAAVPTFRPDITIEEDLVEEVLRLVGYDHIPTRLPPGGPAPEPSPDVLADRTRDVLAALGLHEIVTWAFVPRASLTALGDPALTQGIAVKNPLSADYEVMRTSLVTGLAEAARRNLARGVSDVRVFEVGPVVHPAAGDAHHLQTTHAAGLLIGRRRGWLKPGEPLDFFDAKGVVDQLLAGLGIAHASFSPLAADGGRAGENAAAIGAAMLHPNLSAAVRVGGDSAARQHLPPLGSVGQMHPAVARRLGIEEPAFLFQLRLDLLEGRPRPVRAAASPRFPAVTRDVSFWVDVGVGADRQRAALQGAGEQLLRAIDVLEDFRDPRFVAAGKKGMLWTLTYRADDRTLTDEEVDAAHARVVAALGRAFPIEIR